MSDHALLWVIAIGVSVCALTLLQIWIAVGSINTRHGLMHDDDIAANHDAMIKREMAEAYDKAEREEK
jgi:hypothetical protein